MTEEIFNLLIDNLFVIGVGILVFLIIVWKYFHYRHKIVIKDPIEQELYDDELYIYEEDNKESNDFTDNEEIQKTEVSEAVDEEAPIKKNDQLIIALFVISQDDQGFTGGDIFSVLEEQGLNYGKMRIFHHYGIGEIKTKLPVFSIANMLEPGIFDPKIMNEFVSPGLVLFMRLPGPFGGRVAFELMLNKAQRIAEILEGKVIDEQHAELTPQTINYLREHIAYFEGRKA